MKFLFLRTSFFISFCCTINFTAFCQPYEVGTLTTTIYDSTRNNRPVPVEIYYPADVPGANVPLASGSILFPTLAFGHGFVMVWSAYANVWNAVVPEGYIIIFPKTETGFSPSHGEFAKDLAFCLGFLENENTNTQSLFYARLNGNSAVMGHSMGGGSSLLAMQYNPAITAVCNFAAAETNPSAIAACSTIQKPVLLFAGANDCITPPATNQLSMYNALASNCKTLLTINGASHCQFADYNFNCAFGELTCALQPTITRAEQHSITDTYLLPWLAYVLKNDCNAAGTFQQMIDTSTSLAVANNCSFCSTGLPNNSEAWYSLFSILQMDNGNIFIKNDFGPLPHVEIRLHDMQGRLLYKNEIALTVGETPIAENIDLPGVCIITVVAESGNQRINKRKLLLTR